MSPVLLRRLCDLFFLFAFCLFFFRLGFSGGCRFSRRYLERHPAAPLTLRQVDPLIRDLTHYRDLIARKTQEEMPT